MKVAAGLFGIHYITGLQHWMYWNLLVDYKKCYENNKEFLYNDIDVDFYSSTYFSEKTIELLNDYKFTNIKLQNINNKIENEIGNNWIKRNKRFKETIKLILDSNIEYDYVILTRYDVWFKQNPLKLNVDYSKINVICKAKCGPVNTIIDDNFYFMPYGKLEQFYDKINLIDERIWAHEYDKYIDDINYLIDGNYYSHEIPVYTLLRTHL
jgi:hypothetical protein